MALQNIRSNTASKRPLASGLSDGQIAVNTNETSPGLFFKGAGGAVLKVGPVHVGTSAPNSSPATGGSTGNSVGEQWLDTSNSGYVFKIWDGTAWRSETGEFVDIAGDTMTGNLTISGADLVMQNGEIIAASGAEATPSITFDGDLDTGFYKPAADKLAISTGGTSRVIIDDSGQVGIGTVSPTQKLQLQTSNSNCYLRTNDGTVDGYFGVSNASSALQVYTASSSPIQFITNNSEAARINANGNVGIGTSAPRTPLEIEGPSLQDDFITLYGDRNSSNSEIGIAFKDRNVTSGGQDAARIYSQRDGTTQAYDLKIATANLGTLSDQVTVKSTGNVGIGTTAPGAKLDIRGSAGTEVRIDLNEGTTTNPLRIEQNATEGRIQITASQPLILAGQSGAGSTSDIRLETRDQERMRIDSSGRLLVGTSAARTNIDVENTNTTPRIQIEGGDSSTAHALITRYTANNFGGYLSLSKTRSSTSGGNAVVQSGDSLGRLRWLGDDGSDFEVAAQIEGLVDGTPGANDMPGRLVFSTTADGSSSPTERMRIDSAGNVGIGATDPATKLVVADAAPVLRLLSTNTVPATENLLQAIEFFQSDVSGGQGVSAKISGIAANLSGAMNLAFSTGDAANLNERLRIDSAGKVGIGTTSPAGLLNISNLGAEGYEFIPGDSSNVNRTQHYNRSGAVYITNASRAATHTWEINATEKARIDSSGRLLVGTSTAYPSYTGTPQFQISGTGISDASAMLRCDVNTQTGASIISFTKSRGAKGTQAIVQSNDYLGFVTFAGSDGTNFIAAARIDSQVDVTPGTNDMPGRLVFSTTVAGSSSPTERLRITSTGNVGIGTSAPQAKLDVQGGSATNSVAAHIRAGDGGSTTGLIIDGDNEAGDILLKVRSNSTATPSDADTKFIIEGGGNVGIGTSAPSYKLDILSSSINIFRIVTPSESGSPLILAANSNTATPSNQFFVAHNAAEVNIGNARSGDLTFHTNNTEKARIDANGKFLINASQSKPIGSYSNSLLQVKQDNSSTQAAFSAIAYGSSGTTFPRILLSRANGTEASPTAAVNNSNLGYIQFQGYDGTNFVPSALITSSVDDTPGTNDMPGRLVFSTTADGASTPTERMRIKANGSILFADEDESAITAGTSNGKAILSSGIMYSARATTAAASHIIFTNTNGIVGQISTSGSNTAFSTASDYRLKENVVPLANAADRLNQLQVHRFNFIANPETTVDGFLAHEAQAVVPECVTGTKDEVDDEGNPVYQGIDQSKIVPLLTAALQEALAKIETLEQRLSDAGI